MTRAQEARAKEFARILFGVEDLGRVNMTDEAEWRRMLDAIDFAVQTQMYGWTVTEGGESVEAHAP